MELVAGNILPYYGFDEMTSLTDEGIADIQGVTYRYITKSDLRDANIFVLRKLP